VVLYIDRPWHEKPVECGYQRSNDYSAANCTFMVAGSDGFFVKNGSIFLHLDVPGIGAITARTDGEFECRHGDTVFITPDDTKIHRFDDKSVAMA
jgi:hypothetical protein